MRKRVESEWNSIGVKELKEWNDIWAKELRVSEVVFEQKKCYVRAEEMGVSECYVNRKVCGELSGVWEKYSGMSVVLRHKRWEWVKWYLSWISMSDVLVGSER